MELRQETSQGCCGIQTLWNFGNTNVTNGTSTHYTEKEINDAIDNILQPKVTFPYGELLIPKAISLIALNEVQHNKFHNLLIKKKFKMLIKGWNSSHKNYNYLYGISLKKGKKKLRIE